MRRCNSGFVALFFVLYISFVSALIAAELAQEHFLLLDKRRDEAIDLEIKNTVFSCEQKAVAKISNGDISSRTVWTPSNTLKQKLYSSDYISRAVHIHCEIKEVVYDNNLFKIRILAEIRSQGNTQRSEYMSAWKVKNISGELTRVYMIRGTV